MDTPQKVNREERDMFDRIYATTYHIKMTDSDRHTFVRSAIKLAKEVVSGKPRRRKVDEFIPLKEMKDRCSDESKHKWSHVKTCPECGDRMWWNEYMEKWLCRSWIYMEGGC